MRGKANCQYFYPKIEDFIIYFLFKVKILLLVCQKVLN